MSKTIGNVDFVDSHTEGEPTRAIVAGYPVLSGATLADKAQDFALNHDMFRRGVILEPRGSDVLVGALVLEPQESGHIADVIFFNNKKVLGMCGHGTLGVAETLRLRKKLKPGVYKIGTPVGEVSVELLHEGAAVENVASFVHLQNVNVAGLEMPVIGDVAYGGNWFFLTSSTPCPVLQSNHRELSDFSIKVMARLREQGITGAGGAEIDHVEIFGAPTRSDCDSKNFVMCPGGAFDRSPCGTGTSAKVALLAVQGKLPPGAVWRQESLIGSSFRASYRVANGTIYPRIEGRAFLTGFGMLSFDADDPFRFGIDYAAS
jgi:proline racemase